MKAGDWLLVALEAEVNGRFVAVRDSDGQVRELTAVPRGTRLIEVFRAWEQHRGALQAYDTATAKVIPSPRLEAPLKYPSNLICIGANYRRHLQEMGVAPEPTRPFVFLKPPSSTIVGDGEDIVIRRESDHVDWEGEIAVVVGKSGRDIAVADAMSYVAGYTLANDVSARGVFHNPDAIHPAFAYDWLAVKGQDTFCPLGPGILPAWFIEDPTDIPFELHVSGSLKQQGVTSEMIMSIAQCVAHASTLMTLNPGDVIATGTPQGVGGGRGDFLVEGDEVVISCPRIGTLSNRVRVLERNPAHA